MTPEEKSHSLGMTGNLRNGFLRGAKWMDEEKDKEIAALKAEVERLRYLIDNGLTNTQP